MSYTDGRNVHHAATRTRLARITKRYIAKFGRAGSANLLHLTGKQAARYAKAGFQDNLARYGETCRGE
jgi:hypothetical protein